MSPTRFISERLSKMAPSARLGSRAPQRLICLVADVSLVHPATGQLRSIEVNVTQSHEPIAIDHRFARRPTMCGAGPAPATAGGPTGQFILVLFGAGGWPWLGAHTAPRPG